MKDLILLTLLSLVFTAGAQTVKRDSKSLIRNMMEKIEMIEIRAELLFFNSAKTWFIFPIKKPIRISLWEDKARYSTPCEIVCDLPIYENRMFLVDVKFPFNYLHRKVMEQNIFFLGVFPSVVGSVKVIKILKSP